MHVCIMAMMIVVVDPHLSEQIRPSSGLGAIGFWRDAPTPQQPEHCHCCILTAWFRFRWDSLRMMVVSPEIHEAVVSQ